MPPKIYFSDAQKILDQRKGTAPGNATKTNRTNKTTKGVVKSSSAKTTSVGRKAVTQKNSVVSKKPAETADKQKQKSNIQTKVVAKVSNRVKPIITNQSNQSNSTGQTPLGRAVQTAKSIVNNPKHVKHSDVKSLLDSYQKGWIVEEKFIDILKGLLFE